MSKRLAAFFAVFVFAVSVVTTPAMARISIGADVATWLEMTEDNSTSATGNTSVSFGDPGVNLHIYGDVASGVDAYVEIFSGPGTNTISQDNLAVNEAYIDLNEMGPVDVKVGQFEVDFGNRHLSRSDVAQVQDNPLVGNDIMDVVARQVGLEVSGEVAGGNMGWALGITNGTADADFSDNGGFALIPKFWGNFGPGLSAALSYYTVDKSGAPPGGFDNLFTPQITAGGFPTVFTNLPYQSGAIVQAGLQNIGGSAPGQDISAWQLDFGWENQMAEVNTWWGSVEDDNPAPSAEMTYYGLEGVFNFTPQAYGAARYSVATNDSSNAPAGDQSDRLQVGVGYNLNENTLAKLEWIDQTNEDPTTGFGVGPDADGFIAELSASF